VRDQSKQPTSGSLLIMYKTMDPRLSTLFHHPAMGLPHGHLD
jgi:hypothetical protein